jgi:hypothetical protein
MATRDAETTTAVGVMTTFPLPFLPITTMPKAFLPGRLQVVAAYNPVSYVSDAMHARPRWRAKHPRAAAGGVETGSIPQDLHPSHCRITRASLASGRSSRPLPGSCGEPSVPTLPPTLVMLSFTGLPVALRASPPGTASALSSNLVQGRRAFLSLGQSPKCRTTFPEGALEQGY